MSEEIRVTNDKTGGQKGSKIKAYDLLPVEPLAALAELYGRGKEKYAARNWERGYDWSLSYAALQRHANAFWGGEEFIPQTPEGEDDDPTAGMPHLSAVAWHAFALLEWMYTHPELDDRPTTLANRIDVAPVAFELPVEPLSTADKARARELGLMVPVSGFEATRSYPGTESITFEGVKLSEYPDPEAAPGYETPTVYEDSDFEVDNGE